MPATLKVTRVEKVVSPADNGTVLEVEFNIVDGDAVETRKLGFPLNTSPDTLKEELKKHLDTYILEKEQAAVNAERDAAEKQADETIAALQNFEVGTSEAPAQAEQPNAEVSPEQPAA